MCASQTSQIDKNNMMVSFINLFLILGGLYVLFSLFTNFNR